MPRLGIVDAKLAHRALPVEDDFTEMPVEATIGGICFCSRTKSEPTPEC